MDSILRVIKFFIPKAVFKALAPSYHLFLAFSAAAFYGFPSRKLKVIGVTGTNGKSTVVHMITSILEATPQQEKTASVSSLRFRVNGEEWQNALKMTMPGRFGLQKFLRRAVNAGCKYAVLEVTSEGIKQFRHVGIDFYIAVLTNITPEHIESHGSFEKYREAKAELFKKAKIHILNGEDPSIEYFLKIPADKRVVYSKKDFPSNIKLKLIGDFNLENAVAAYHAGKILGIDSDIIKRALEKIESVPGRLEFVQEEPFAVVVDYAHTPDALRKVYETLRPPAGKKSSSSKSDFGIPKKSDFFPGDFKETGGRLVCVLGSAGGGRDKWKRREMGRIATEFCDEIILTNEDPYDENPLSILEDIEKGFSQIRNPTRLPDGQESEIRNNTTTNPRSSTINYKLILDRREAMHEALKLADHGDVVIITGKGAEPWIMGPNGSRTPWDDREIVRDELKNF